MVQLSQGGGTAAGLPPTINPPATGGGVYRPPIIQGNPGWHSTATLPSIPVPFITAPPPSAAPAPRLLSGSGASAAPAPTLPSGSGGSNPYRSDPGYLLALQQQQQGTAALRAALNAQIAQQIIAYGDPSLAQEAGFGLDSQDAAYARQNYLSGNSELARLDKAHQLARQAVINTLAGRGLLYSGETGYQTGRADQTYGNNVYDAQQAVLQAIQGERSGELDKEMNLQQSVVQALEQAYQNYLQSGVAYGSGDGGGNGGPGGSQQTLNPALLNHSHSLFDVPQVGPAPKGMPTHAPAPKRIATALMNPYTTGRKRRG